MVGRGSGIVTNRRELSGRSPYADGGVETKFRLAWGRGSGITNSAQPGWESGIANSAQQGIANSAQQGAEFRLAFQQIKKRQPVESGCLEFGWLVGWYGLLMLIRYFRFPLFLPAGRCME